MELDRLGPEALTPAQWGLGEERAASLPRLRQGLCPSPPFPLPPCTAARGPPRWPLGSFQSDPQLAGSYCGNLCQFPSFKGGVGVGVGEGDKILGTESFFLLV